MPNWTGYFWLRITSMGNNIGAARSVTILAVADHVFSSMPASKLAAVRQGLEAQHRARRALDRSMVLLNEIVELFDRPSLNRTSDGAVDLVDRGLIGGVLVHRDLLRQPVLTHRFSKLDVRFIHAPARVDLAIGLPEQTSISGRNRIVPSANH